MNNKITLSVLLKKKKTKMISIKIMILTITNYKNS